MATTKVILQDDAWTLAASGACYVSQARNSLFAAPADLPLQEVSYSDDILFHIGTVAPAVDTFDYDTFTEKLSYQGSEDVYLRSAKGQRVVKVTEIV